jgi:hypothetical protein
MADAQRRTRMWLWILGAIIVVLVVALVVVLVTRDDDDDTPPTTTTTRATTTTTTTTTSTSTTTTTIPATTTTVALPVITQDPQSYGEYLYAAWQNNNRTAAANVASTEAIDQMFAKPYPANGPYTLANCGPAAGSLYCTWNGQGGATIQMAIRTLTGGLPIQVQSVQFMP